MPTTNTIGNRLLALIAVLLSAVALRESYPVTMPLAVATMVIAASWPLQPWFERTLPKKLSYVATASTLIVVLLSFMAAVYFATAQAVWAFSKNAETFAALYQSATSWAETRGISLGGEQGYTRLISFGQNILSNSYTVFVYLGFISLLVMLGLPEIPALRAKLKQILDARENEKLLLAVDEVTVKVRQYLGVTSLTSLLTGVASVVWAYATGLELAFVWGALNFLLNFIPVVGNLVAIIPPSLYAILQFQNVTMPLIVFVGFGAMQIAISFFIYPMLQGRSLSLSPVAIILALSFWSWVWGIAGALIAVPLTATLIIACSRFASTQWIAVLLSSPAAEPPQNPPTPTPISSSSARSQAEAVP